MSTPVQVYTAAQAAELLACAVTTVEELARSGELPGIQPGRAWVFPAGALAQRLDQMALEQAAQRRKPEPDAPPGPAAAPQVLAVAVAPAPKPARRPRSRPLPKLVPMGSGA